MKSYLFVLRTFKPSYIIMYKGKITGVISKRCSTCLLVKYENTRRSVIACMSTTDLNNHVNFCHKTLIVQGHFITNYKICGFKHQNV